MAGKSNKNYGVNIKLSVDSAQLNEDLGKVKSTLTPVRSELLNLQKSLKLDADTKSIQRAMQLSRTEITETANRVNILKDKIQELGKEGSKATVDDIKELTRELTFAETEAKRAVERFKELSKVSVAHLTKEFEKAAANLTKIGKAATTFVTLPILAAGTAAFKMSSDMQESLNKVDVVFEESSDIIKKWSDTTLEAYGIANLTALDLAANFGDMATSMGFSTEEAAGMSQQLVSLAGDVASFKNIGLDQVNTALTAIFTGNATAMKSLGVVMTEANLKAYALKQGISVLYEDMDQASKVALRYEYAMEMLSNANGDFANTIESPANQLRLFQESLKQLGATIGEEITPMITPLIKNLNELLTKFAGMDEGTKKLVVQFATFAATMGPAMLIMGQLNKVVQVAITLHAGLKAAKAAKTAVTIAETASEVANTAATAANATAQTANAAATNAAATAQHGLNAAQAASPVGAIATLVSILVAGMVSLIATTVLTAEKTSDLTRQVEENRKAYEQRNEAAEKSTENTLAEIGLVERLLPRIEELNNKKNKTSYEQNVLNGLVEQANGIIPDLVGNIDKETGAYNLNTQAIENNIQALKDQARVKANSEKVTSNITRLNEIDDQIKKAALEAEKAKEVEKRYEEARKNIADKQKKSGISSADYPEMVKFNVLQREMDEARKALDLYDSLNKEQEKLEKNTQKLLDQNSGLLGTTDSSKSSYNYTSADTGKADKVKTRAELDLEAYKETRDFLEYQRDMDMISDKKFYEQLREMQQHYLKDNIDEYRKVDVEIKKFYDSEAEAAKKAAEEAAKAAEKARQDRLSSFNKYVDEITKLAKEATDERIKALDKEAEAYDRLMVKEKQEKKLREAQNKLAYEADAENRRELEKHIAQLQKEIQQREMKEYISDTKDAIQSQFAEIEAAAVLAKNRADAAVNTTTTSNEFNTSNIVNANGLTAAQAQSLVEQALKKILYQV